MALQILQTGKFQRLIAILGISIFCTYSLANELPGEKIQESLVMFNWSDYMDPKLITQFKQETKIEVREVYYESDDQRDDILLNMDRAYIDIIVINGAMLNSYRKRGWLAPVNDQLIPNRRNLNPRWQEAFIGAKDYGIPYFWGTLGIAYRSDLVKEQITSWRQFFQPNDNLRGKIVLINTTRDVVGMALKSLGYSANSSDSKELSEAGDILLQQKPFVHEYSYLATDETSSLVSGDVIAAMLYNGDALTVQEHHEAIKYLVPEEGGNIWVDYLTVSSISKHKDAAWQFINFLHRPENAAQLAKTLYFATPNKAAEQYLSQEFLNDDTIYPSKEILQKSEFHQPLPARAINIQNTIFSRVTNPN